jgi:hypothetical protein
VVRGTTNYKPNKIRIVQNPTPVSLLYYTVYHIITMDNKVLVYGGIFLIAVILLGGAFVYFGNPDGYTGKFTAVREDAEYELDSRWDCDLVSGRPRWVRTQGTLSPTGRGSGYLKQSYTGCQGADYEFTCGTWERGAEYDKRALEVLWCSKTHLNYACECYKIKTAPLVTSTGGQDITTPLDTSTELEDSLTQPDSETTTPTLTPTTNEDLEAYNRLPGVCIDSDGGNNLLVAGTCSSTPNGTLTEECVDNDRVREYECNNNECIYSYPPNCPDGKTCVNGACQ